MTFSTDRLFPGGGYRDGRLSADEGDGDRAGADRIGPESAPEEAASPYALVSQDYPGEGSSPERLPGSSDEYVTVSQHERGYAPRFGPRPPTPASDPLVNQMDRPPRIGVMRT
jgi:hypothetical protein